jgi:tetratricopeptide (TPR) repeat protein
LENLTMWRSKLRQILSRPPEFLTTSSNTGSTFSGKYLLLDGKPYALGKQIGEGDEAQVFELVSLRSGYFDNVIKICKHRMGSSAYQIWARAVRDESNPHSALPEIESIPARLVQLECGGIVKIQRYISRNPDEDWGSSYPAGQILQLLHLNRIAEAENICHVLIEVYGQKAILLEQLALVHLFRNEVAEARKLYERCVAAHRAEGNTGILGALYNLALTLLKLHETEPHQGVTTELEMGNGMIYRQQIFEVDAEAPREPTDLSDEALEVLIEALSIEPYFSLALAFVCHVITPAEAGSFEVAGNALTQIDPDHPAASHIREELESLEDSKNRKRSEPEVPAHVESYAREMLAKLDATYEPPVPDEAQEAESLFLAALQHEQRDDYVRAERDLTRACSLDPNNPKYVVELSDVYCLQGKWQQAKEYVTSMVDNFPDDWRVYEALGRIKSELAEFRESCIAFHKALACAPPDPWIITARLGSSYCMLDKLDVALDHLEEAYREKSRDWRVNVFLLQCLKRLAIRHSNEHEDKQCETTFQKASAILESAAEQKIMNGPLFFVKAQILMFQRRGEETLDALDEVLRLDPDDSQARKMYDLVKADLETVFFKRTTTAARKK